MSQSGPAVVMNMRWFHQDRGEGGAGESPDTNTTCGGQQDKMGREDGTKQSHSGGFVGARTVSKTIKKTGETTWGVGGGVPHQMCFCMLVLEEEGGHQQYLKGVGRG